MLPTHAVGIDLGTTYSCLAYLNEHGEPISVPNKDGELLTPSVVLFEGKQIIVGTEALRNSIRHPEHVVVHAKRYMGDLSHRWKIAGKSYSPIDISTYILRSLLESARDKIGTIERAVITVPAQFSEVQRQATVEAGKRAGLKHIDIINEPVAAALCFVLGTEGIWFTEIARPQTVMVVDLGGGTFDLSMVNYEKNEVTVIATGGDLHLGGLDWNNVLESAIAKQFQKEFGINPMKDRESAQALALEAEQTKRSLSVRPRAALTVAASGQRKTYQVELEQFERLSQGLVDRMEELTLGLLKEHGMGWAKVDVVLATGGASRMPMVRTMLKRLSGRTLNTALSPDQSIAHGATYYAGMLLTNSEFAKSILTPKAATRLAQFKQQSVTARALGILVRNPETNTREPHYILPANTALPTSVSQVYGTVIPNQRRVRLRIVESGTAADASHVEIGLCQIDPLPEGLPEGSEIEATMTYDEQARLHVRAKVLMNGQEARTEIIRTENLAVSALNEAVHIPKPPSAINERGADDEIKVKSEPLIRAVPLQTSQRPAQITAKPILPNLAARPVVKSQSGSTSNELPDWLQVIDQPQAASKCASCGKPMNECRCPKSPAGTAGTRKKIRPPTVARDEQPPQAIKKPQSPASRQTDDSEFWRNLGQ